MKVYEILVTSYYRPFKAGTQGRVDRPRVKNWKREMQCVYVCTEDGMQALNNSFNHLNLAAQRVNIGKPKVREATRKEAHRLKSTTFAPDGVYCIMATA